MDKLFIYIFTVWTVIFWVPTLLGVKASDIDIGLTLRQWEPSRVIAQKNGELVLNCSVEYEASLGKLTLNWTKDGIPVELDRRVQKVQNGSLYIRRIIHRPKKNWTDEGRYRCFATITNDNGQVGRVLARDVQVEVAGMEKRFITEPQPQIVPVGGVARFQCKIQAVPPAMYEWQRDKTALPQNDRYLVLSSGILQITGVVQADAGLYRCYATQGSLHELPGHDIDVKYSVEAALNVVPGNGADDVKIISNTKNTTAVLGSPAFLECLVQGFTGRVEWLKGDDSRLVPENSRVERVGNNLRFVETELSDTGKYECVAGNIRATMTLNIIKKPIISKSTSGQRFPRAQWVYLDCETDDHPKPTITWLKDGDVIKIEDKENYRINKKNQLVITLSQTEDSGFFQCLMSNEAGTVSAITRLEIFEQANSPKMPTNLTALTVTSTSILLTWQPPKVSMNSRILAYTVHHKRDGGQSHEIVVQDKKISLQALKAFSEYSIFVTAYSQAGQGPPSERLVVKTKEDKPSLPPLVTLEPQTRAILVKWEPLPRENRNGIITGHRVYVRQAGAPVTQRIVTGIAGNATSYLIAGLKPDTEYEVRMLAGTSVGYRETFAEELWPWVSVKTLTDSYMLAPNIKIMPLNNTAINVSWSYADTSIIKHFIIQLQLIPSGELLKTMTLSAQNTHAMFSQLDETSVYEVTVVVHTLDGLQSEAVEEFSAVNILKPAGPGNLQVVMATATSIGVQWEEPPSDMVVFSFTVRYRQTGTASYKYMPSDSNNVLLENLEPSAEYEISVRANAENLVSLYSEKLLVNTKVEGVPSEPLMVQIQSIKTGKVRVMWRPPAQPNGRIWSYTILYTTMPSESDDLWIRVEKNGSETSAMIPVTDLSGDVYYFKLRANSKLGAGKTTSIITIVSRPKQAESENGETRGKPEEQKLGIIIGISIGVFCIIICFIIILLRHRCFGNSNNQQPQTQPARFHGNGHIPGNGNGHAVHLHENREMVAGMLEMDAYTPMLHHLPENEQSDSKGGGDSSVILTANGAKLNGFALKHNGIVNGQIPNGHVILPNHYKEEHLDAEEKRGLIAVMLAGSHQPCMMENVGEESFTTSRYEDLGSLDNIDTGSSEEIIHKTKGKELENSGEDSGEGSLTTSNRTSSEYGSSIPRSDTTDTGDTVVYCGSASRRRDTGIGGERCTSVRDRSDLPIDIPQSSPSCEDTCHDGGTSFNVQESRAVSGSVLPHSGGDTEMFSPPTIATSTSLSQANRETDNSHGGEPRPVVRSTSDGAVPQVNCNGSPPGLSAQSERRRHPATSNGVPPQMYVPGVDTGYPRHTNGIPPQMNSANRFSRRPQGHINGLSVADNNPNQFVTSREANNLVETPQEHVRSANVDASPRNGHFKV